MCYPYPRSETILQGRASFLPYFPYFLILFSFYIHYLLFLKICICMYLGACGYVCLDFLMTIILRTEWIWQNDYKALKTHIFSFLFVFAFTFSDGFAFLKMRIFCASMPKVLKTSREKSCSQADWSLYKYMDFKLGQAPRLSANS